MNRVRKAAGAVSGARDADLCSVNNPGIMSGTKVATSRGWSPVQNITVGDKVLTFDGGLQEVLAITRQKFSADENSFLLRVPAEALGNREEIFLLPSQHVMVESDTAENLYGDPFVLLPALALEGIRGIERSAPELCPEVVTLEFARDEVVFANVGALFFCPKRQKVDIVQVAGADQPAYEALPMSEAKKLASAIAMEDAADLVDGGRFAA
ncbi:MULTISPECIES: Hint domain-containing protein [Halocynthiibacter]|uniref:Hint domain-containing protein n=1 Tax=Halocynthiibacter halioticoli TaxID=2986804 RepID=A0AAE3IZY3_9RHOB|nr:MULTISPECIES: Hint domain-containing protein [Halocynthiibacter]MCV6825198.1 Hint domain-containing protein [Halocynthiibacter halioticoli]MCW4058199.1 Hint domain-containing protein [Halocynthiibacter sp. SDUM655004]